MPDDGMEGAPAWANTLIKKMAAELESSTSVRAEQRDRVKRLEEQVGNLLEQLKTTSTQVAAANESKVKQPTAKLPSELPGNASLKEFNGWHEKFQDYRLLSRMERLPKNEQMKWFSLP